MGNGAHLDEKRAAELALRQGEDLLMSRQHTGREEMPFIHIRSLPLKESPAIDRVIKGVLKDFADRTGVEPRHIHVTWEFFLPGHYAKGTESPAVQPESGHPLIVDLLTPDFNDQERVLLMLQSTAESLSKRAGVPIDNIFINHRQARSGMVFDDGKPVFW